MICMSEETIDQVAARCLDNPAFAQAVLSGDEFPEVREAILADLYRVDPEGEEAAGGGRLRVEYVRSVRGYTKVPEAFDPLAKASTWETMPRPSLHRLAGRRVNE